MRGLLKRVVSEPGADTAESFVRGIRILAATYTILFFAWCAGEVARIEVRIDGARGDERMEVDLDYPPR
jgi:hypothetical protein